MDKLREADLVVNTLGSALSRTDQGLDNVPGLLLRLINEDLWQERIIVRTGGRVRFERFEQFVTTPPLEGLGASLVTLRRVCGGNVEALDALDRVTQRTPADNKPVDNVHGQDKKPDGNTAAAALRRLRKERPDLHARVLAEELTPHRAMVEAGFRKPTITIPREVDAAVRALRRHFTPDEQQALVAALTEELP